VGVSVRAIKTFTSEVLSRSVLTFRHQPLCAILNQLEGDYRGAYSGPSNAGDHVGELLQVCNAFPGSPSLASHHRAKSHCLRGRGRRCQPSIIFGVFSYFLSPGYSSALLAVAKTFFYTGLAACP